MPKGLVSHLPKGLAQKLERCKIYMGATKWGARTLVFFKKKGTKKRRCNKSRVQLSGVAKGRSFEPWLK